MKKNEDEEFGQRAQKMQQKRFEIASWDCAVWNLEYGTAFFYSQAISGDKTIPNSSKVAPFVCLGLFFFVL